MRVIIFQETEYSGSSPEDIVSAMNDDSKFPREDWKEYIQSFAKRFNEIFIKDRRIRNSTAAEFLADLESVGIAEIIERN